MRQVLVLAGGFGKRLRSAVSDVPKPLAPIGGTPFLVYLLSNYASQGAKEIVLLVHYEAEKIEKVVKTLSTDAGLEGVNIKILVEEKPLGTGGSILNAMQTLDLVEPVIVVNADTWLAHGMEILNGNVAPAITSVKVENNSRYGLLDFDNGRVTEFIEKGLDNGPGWINAGMYLLSRESFIGLEPGDVFSLENTVLPRLAASGELNIVLLDTEFIDIGIPEDYFRFCEWMKKRKTNEV